MKKYKVVGQFNKGVGIYDYTFYVRATDSDDAESVAKFYAFDQFQRLGAYYGTKTIEEI